MSDPDVGRMWADYLQAERDHVKETRTKALELLVAKMTEQPEEARNLWARELARQVVDDKRQLPVRFPLFRNILLPALIEGILTQRAGCARWLANFESLLIHSEKEAIRLPESLRNPVALLQEASSC
jgi:hypothetical protein